MTNEDRYYHPCCASWGDHASTCPAAPDATAGDGLRSDEWWTQLYLAASRALDEVPYAAAPEYPAPHAAAFRSAVEPVLRDVLAAAARDAEKVRRVTDLADEFSAGPDVQGQLYDGAYVADAFRAALDGA